MVNLCLSNLEDVPAGSDTNINNCRLEYVINRQTLGEE